MLDLFSRGRDRLVTSSSRLRGVGRSRSREPSSSHSNNGNDDNSNRSGDSRQQHHHSDWTKSKSSTSCRVNSIRAGKSTHDENDNNDDACDGGKVPRERRSLLCPSTDNMSSSSSAAAAHHNVGELNSETMHRLRIKSHGPIGHRRRDSKLLLSSGRGDGDGDALHSSPNSAAVCHPRHDDGNGNDAMGDRRHRERRRSRSLDTRTRRRSSSSRHDNRRNTVDNEPSYLSLEREVNALNHLPSEPNRNTSRSRDHSDGGRTQSGPVFDTSSHLEREANGFNLSIEPNLHVGHSRRRSRRHSASGRKQRGRTNSHDRNSSHVHNDAYSSRRRSSSSGYDNQHRNKRWQESKEGREEEPQSPSSRAKERRQRHHQKALFGSRRESRPSHSARSCTHDVPFQESSCQGISSLQEDPPALFGRREARSQRLNETLSRSARSCIQDIMSFQESTCHEIPLQDPLSSNTTTSYASIVDRLGIETVPRSSFNLSMPERMDFDMSDSSERGEEGLWTHQSYNDDCVRMTSTPSTSRQTRTRSNRERTKTSSLAEFDDKGGVDKVSSLPTTCVGVRAELDSQPQLASWSHATPSSNDKNSTFSVLKSLSLELRGVAHQNNELRKNEGEATEEASSGQIMTGEDHDDGAENIKMNELSHSSMEYVSLARSLNQIISSKTQRSLNRRRRTRRLNSNDGSAATNLSSSLPSLRSASSLKSVQTLDHSVKHVTFNTKDPCSNVMVLDAIRAAEASFLSASGLNNEITPVEGADVARRLLHLSLELSKDAGNNNCKDDKKWSNTGQDKELDEQHESSNKGFNFYDLGGSYHKEEDNTATQAKKRLDFLVQRARSMPNKLLLPSSSSSSSSSLSLRSHHDREELQEEVATMDSEEAVTKEVVVAVDGSDTGSVQSRYASHNQHEDRTPKKQQAVHTPRPPPPPPPPRPHPAPKSVKPDNTECNHDEEADVAKRYELLGYKLRKSADNIECENPGYISKLRIDLDEVLDNAIQVTSRNPDEPEDSSIIKEETRKPIAEATSSTQDESGPKELQVGKKKKKRFKESKDDTTSSLMPLSTKPKNNKVQMPKSIEFINSSGSCYIKLQEDGPPSPLHEPVVSLIEGHDGKEDEVETTTKLQHDHLRPPSGKNMKAPRYPPPPPHPRNRQLSSLGATNIKSPSNNSTAGSSAIVPSSVDQQQSQIVKKQVTASVPPPPPLWPPPQRQRRDSNTIISSSNDESNSTSKKLKCIISTTTATPPVPSPPPAPSLPKPSRGSNRSSSRRKSPNKSYSSNVSVVSHDYTAVTATTTATTLSTYTSASALALAVSLGSASACRSNYSSLITADASVGGGSSGRRKRSKSKNGRRRRGRSAYKENKS